MNNETKLQPTMHGTRLPPDFKQVRKYLRTARQREPKVYAVTPDRLVPLLFRLSQARNATDNPVASSRMRAT